MADMYNKKITESNYQPYVQKEIISKADGMKSAADFNFALTGAELGYKAYETYDTNKALRETEEGVYDLMSTYHLGTTSPDEVKRLQDKNNRLNSQIDGAVSDTYAGIETDVDVKALETELNTNSRKIELALQQERISPSEFYNRYSLLVRNLVRQNPSRAKEIMGHAETTLDLYGFKKRIKDDEKLIDDRAKAFDDNVKFMRQYLKDLKLPQNLLLDEEGQITVESLNNARLIADQEQTDKYVFDKFKEDSERGNILDANEQKEVIKKGLVGKAAAGHILDVKLKLNDIFGGVDPKYANMGDDQLKKVGVDYISQTVQNWRDMMSPYMSNPVIAKQVEDQAKLMEALQSNMQQYSSGVYLKEQLENNLNVVKLLQQNKLYKDMDVEKIKFLMQTFGKEGMGLDFGQLFLSSPVDPDDPESPTKQDILFDFLKEEFTNANKQIYDFATDQPYSKDQKNLMYNGKNVTSTVLDIAGKNAANNPNATNIQRFDRSINRTLATINSEENQSARFKQHEALIKSIGDKERTAGWTNLPGQTKQELNNAIEVYTGKVYNDFQNYLSKNPEMEWSVSGDAYGEFVLKGGDNQMKGVYLNRFNTALKAYANLNGKETKDVVNEFVDKFAPGVTDPTMWRRDNTKKSPVGYRGEIINEVTGQPMTEVSIQFDDVNDGKDIPLITPYSTDEDIAYLKKTDPKDPNFFKNMPQGMTDRAIKHANDMKAEGKDVFYQDLPKGVTNTKVNPKDIEVAVNALDQIQAMIESNGRHIDSNGQLITNPESGAKGKYQIMPRTAKNPGFGVEPLKNDSVEEHQRFYREYMTALLKEFDGDIAKASAAYHTGVGDVKKFIKMSPDNWYSLLGAKGQKYVDDVVANYAKY